MAAAFEKKQFTKRFQLLGHSSENQNPKNLLKKGWGRTLSCDLLLWFSQVTPTNPTPAIPTPAAAPFKTGGTALSRNWTGFDLGFISLSDIVVGVLLR